MDFSDGRFHVPAAKDYLKCILGVSPTSPLSSLISPAWVAPALSICSLLNWFPPRCFRWAVALHVGRSLGGGLDSHRVS